MKRCGSPQNWIELHMEISKVSYLSILNLLFFLSLLKLTVNINYMSIANALTFIHQFEADANLRVACNRCKSNEEMLQLLEKKEMAFTSVEFDEAINGLLVKCQTYEQAGYIEQIKMWFNMFKK
jgi:hypothetical protein